MNVEVPDIKTLEKITGIKINDLAEMVKAFYKMIIDNKVKTEPNKNNPEIDENSKKYIKFSFKNPEYLTLINDKSNFSNLETFISCLGNIGANFELTNIVDDNDESKILSIDFMVKRTCLKQ
ncbi:hypothetical protein DY120_01145 [Apilactobacillus micheneri]|uniref:Uncharacterized protein n=1 Tax=Apilactobacillus micheneri TaxID=1899430 RepID=A0ABY2YZL7_9LACO|nr:hypothetical protein [Apilactobacillus micheneri]TPR26332.1 hypothetical protein DY114_01145 [Apilactobacillus micheneri]TPR27086.1 hypothetical protein DY111_01145 [Apilactobacillus micheneri]TPR27944.1 hypothetical protein DY113_04920 [Apilactobacillus micheneri]TPR31849.1 hypothetical protein DY117_01145 [Apilactobacillus micheneri]TPR32253.1 hypothetical protein DY120_01145 [Apilactobacillus micheneri]